jgi:hypothetical protein
VTFDDGYIRADAVRKCIEALPLAWVTYPHERAEAREVVRSIV